jgi:small-conductance mechanosensitive channel
MTTLNPKQVNPEEVSKKADKDSKTPSSAEEQKNNSPQSTKNAAEENSTLVSQHVQDKSSRSLSEQTTPSTLDILGADVSKIFGWLEQANHSPRQLKGLLDSLDTRIELIKEFLESIGG